MDSIFIDKHNKSLNVTLEERYKALQIKFYEVNKQLLMYKTHELYAYHINNVLSIEEYSKTYANGICNAAVIRLIRLNHIEAVMKHGKFYVVLTDKTKNYNAATNNNKSKSEIRKEAMLTGKSENSIRRERRNKAEQQPII